MSEKIVKQIRISMRKKIIELFANGNINLAIRFAKEWDFIKLYQNFLKSLEIKNDLQLYKHHYQQNNRRIAGQQEQPGERQIYVMNQISKFKPECLLDVGCADGSFASFCLQRKIVKRVVGIDPWIEGIAHARKTLSTDETVFILGLIEEIELPNFYDIIHLGEILEHVIEPLVMLKRIINSKTKAVVLTVPLERPKLSQEEIEIVTNGSPAEHIRHCSRVYLDELFSEVNMKSENHHVMGTGWKNLVSTYIPKEEVRRSDS